ncbi:hypothetical protein P2C71_16920, partial [Xanthomonas perforans]
SGLMLTLARSGLPNSASRVINAGGAAGAAAAGAGAAAFSGAGGPRGGCGQTSGPQQKSELKFNY